MGCSLLCAPNSCCCCPTPASPSPSLQNNNSHSLPASLKFSFLSCLNMIFTIASKFYSVITIALNPVRSLLSIMFMTIRLPKAFESWPRMLNGLRRCGHSYRILPGLWYDNHWEMQWTKLDSCQSNKVSHFSCHSYLFHREKALCLLNLKARLTAQVAIETTETTGNCWLVDSVIF